MNQNIRSILATTAIATFTMSCGQENQSSRASSFPTNGTWVSASTGYLGGNPFYNTTIQNWEMYLCRYYETNWGYVYGHIAKGQTTCFVAWGNSHISSSSYQVLQESTGLTWKDRQNAENSKFVVGVCRDRSNRLNGRLITGGNIYGSPENGVCYTTWGNSNWFTYDYDVLTRP